jgi:hypothetical protein
MGVQPVASEAEKLEDMAAKALRLAKLTRDALDAAEVKLKTASASEVRGINEDVGRLRKNWNQSLGEIVIRYPGTKAAEEAQSLLQQAAK